MNHLGIVQGRLTQAPPGCLQWFPQEHWRCEFSLAGALGYHHIEWIVEQYHNESNPLWSNAGIDEINAIIIASGVRVLAVCNGFILEHRLIGDKSVFEQNIRVINQAARIGAKRLVLPLFEASELNTENLSSYAGILRDFGDAAQAYGIEICLETSLNAKTLLWMLDTLNHDNLQCVFDTGNHIGFGHDIYSDIVELGSRVHYVHIKDKSVDGVNVLLGTGLVNFYKVFESLEKIAYQGPITFETTRGRYPVQTAKHNKDMVKFFMREVSP